MKYIFLAIVLFLVSILAYINFYHKNKNIKEGLDLNGQTNYLKNKINIMIIESFHKPFPEIPMILNL